MALSRLGQPQYAYVLRSPDTHLPIYVGKGTWDRTYKHRWQRSPIGAHIRSLVSQGKTPFYERILVKNENEAFELEHLLVEEIGRQDVGTGSLFNRRPGGRKVIHTDDAKLRIGAARIGKHLSEDHKRSISLSLTGTRQSIERRAAHSIRMREWWANRKSTQVEK